jgi:tetratricopeptide (TPR) repeat protein
VDAEPLDVKYNHESNNAKAAITGLMGKADQEPHTAEELVQVLADRMAERIAARLVNTNEKVEVLLGKGGPLDDANRYAVAGQWSRYVEALETMAPFAKPADDSYRLYNIGVGDEALGYKAETPTAAAKYFEQAVIQYRKAGEANPHEKYFIQPVNRIEVALEHYKKLAQPARPPVEPGPSGGTPPVQPPTPAPVRAPAPRPAAGPFQTPTTWRVTEIINGVPVIWDMVASVDLSFSATMGDATVANGTWRYDAAKRTFELTGYNLVLKVPFTCAFSLAGPQARNMNGVCLDQVGAKYKTDAVRQ